MGKPTYRPRNKRRIRSHGFRERMSTRWGREVSKPSSEEGKEAADGKAAKQVRRRLRGTDIREAPS